MTKGAAWKTFRRFDTAITAVALAFLGGMVTNKMVRYVKGREATIQAQADERAAQLLRAQEETEKRLALARDVAERKLRAEMEAAENHQ